MLRKQLLRLVSGNLNVATPAAQDDIAPDFRLFQIGQLGRPDDRVGQQRAVRPDVVEPETVQGGAREIGTPGAYRITTLEHGTAIVERYAALECETAHIGAIEIPARHAALEPATIEMPHGKVRTPGE